MRYTLSETWSGIKSNLSMTIAVIVTMWVSLALFGAGLLAYQQVELMKGGWYDRIEISVFLCNADSVGDNCTPGEDVSAEEKAAIEEVLDTNPEVAEWHHETKEEAFAEFEKAFKGTSLEGTVTVDQMQESYRIKLVNPEQYEGVVSAVVGMPGVQVVQDLREVLDRLFEWLAVLQWGTVIASALLLLAAALQIANTIRMAAFARRREIGIMRLVGASNFYIMLPFLLESLIAALIGALFACGTLALGMQFLIRQKAQVLIQASPWIGWQHAGLAMLGVALVAIALAIIPTLVATRRYLRV